VLFLIVRHDQRVLTMKASRAARDEPFAGSVGLGDELSSILLSFCADTLITHLNEKRGKLDSGKELWSRSWHQDGACLLVDISGFTRLSGELCSAGPGGLDELRQVTSEYLSRLLYLVYSNGGDGKHSCFKFKLNM
jgi:hypothetical protein